MNLAHPSIAIVSYAFRFWLTLRRLFCKQKCRTFAGRDAGKGLSIDTIFVINLNREPGRWFNMQQELKHILDSSGSEALELTERQVAIDAKQFSEDPTKDDEIDPFYTLGEQLFVEPQPLVLPTRLELNIPIKMSRAEIAVARSHINIWKKVAAGNYDYVLILEDDTWFHSRFAPNFDKAWSEIMKKNDGKSKFDILYVSYLKVKHGAPKSFISKNIFRPVRGLWHLSGYVLSREGAKKLISLLPCRGPIDLWINHHFKSLEVFATKSSLISQRRDVKSSNSYSILPALTKIGAINSESASLFNIRPIERPVFVFGCEGSGLSSIAMALSMLGYRCCSDLKNLPSSEMDRLIEGRKDRIFDAYVNIGSLFPKVRELLNHYPKAKFIITVTNYNSLESAFSGKTDELIGADVALLHINEINKWKVICEHLRCAPSACTFPIVNDLGQRITIDEIFEINRNKRFKILKHDISPWVIESSSWWKGIDVVPAKGETGECDALVRFSDHMKTLDTSRWLLRSDTFTDNLALFRPSNVNFGSENGAVFSIKKEALGVREYSAASICSIDQYLYGRFEATIQASNMTGVVTGIFLHRNSPRQEIDIEIMGNLPDRLLINVFYNPGDKGANFDYGYRGTPTYIELGFDASKAFHRYAIEWNLNEICWLVDDKLVHRRVIWNPTPIPNLPMTFHVNCWLTRSRQLAGRISNKRLPATITVSEITLDANSVTTLSINGNQQYSKNKLGNSNQIIQ
jgi:GR25 family glycosyltransferase involved in LPS biosynthesis